MGYKVIGLKKAGIMVYVYEFQIIQSENFFIALPFDFEGGTQGETIQEVSEMTSDWLKTEIEHRLMHGIEIPAATFGNKTKKDGRLLLVAVSASLDTIEAVPAHKAAEMLGVSRGRISQMTALGLLDGYRIGRDAFVTIDSIAARKAEAPRAGRPKSSKSKLELPGVMQA